VEAILRRGLKRLAILAIAGLAIASLWIYWQRRTAWGDLEAALAEADAADPDWRWESLQAQRRALAPEENSAVIIKAVQQALPKHWQNNVQEALEAVPPPVNLTPEQAVQLREELDAIAAAVAEARKLVDFPLGRFPLNVTPDFIGTDFDEQISARSAAQVLALDLRRRLHEADLPDAWTNLIAMLNAGRSLGDEPILTSQMIRMALQEQTVRHLERLLGQGQAPAAGLAELQ
jgi:hypothetical protein